MAQVQSLVWELRSHKPRSMAKGKKQENQKKKEKDKIRKDTRREGQTQRVWSEASPSQERPRTASSNQKPQERPGDRLLQSFWKGPTFLTRRFQASGLVNCETVTCTYFKTPDVWYFAMAGPGHSCQMPTPALHRLG